MREPDIPARMLGYKIPSQTQPSLQGQELNNELFRLEQASLRWFEKHSQAFNPFTLGKTA
jgi:hypothetical protein